MATSTELVLTRHGETEWHTENRYAGVSDVQLTERGRAQAAWLAEWALRTRPDAVVCSALRRAFETARPAACALGLEPVVVDGLREVAFGIAEGRTLAELSADTEGAGVVSRFREDPAAHPFPGSEAPADAAARGAGCLRDIARSHSGATVLVVAHSTMLRLALCALLGIDVGRYRSVFPLLGNGTLTRLRIDHGRPTDDGTAALLSFNVPLRADPIPSSDGSLRRVS